MGIIPRKFSTAFLRDQVDDRDDDNRDADGDHDEETGGLDAVTAHANLHRWNGRCRDTADDGDSPGCPVRPIRQQEPSGQAM